MTNETNPKKIKEVEEEAKKIAGKSSSMKAMKQAGEIIKGGAKEDLTKLENRISERLKKHPKKSTAIAAGIGVVAGTLFGARIAGARKRKISEAQAS